MPLLSGGEAPSCRVSATSVFRGDVRPERMGALPGRGPLGNPQGHFIRTRVGALLFHVEHPGARWRTHKPTWLRSSSPRRR